MVLQNSITTCVYLRSAPPRPQLLFNYDWKDLIGLDYETPKCYFLFYFFPYKFFLIL